MNIFDRCLFAVALLLSIGGSVALYAQAQEAERQSAACRKMQPLKQIALNSDAH